jgi:hypothetical protein
VTSRVPRRPSTSSARAGSGRRAAPADQGPLPGRTVEDLDQAVVVRQSRARCGRVGRDVDEDVAVLVALEVRAHVDGREAFALVALGVELVHADLARLGSRSSSSVCAGSPARPRCTGGELEDAVAVDRAHLAALGDARAPGSATGLGVDRSRVA